MASASGSLEISGLNNMADSIADLATLTLQAWSAADPTAVVLDSQTATFGSASNGEVDLSSTVTLVLDTDETVDTVRLYSGSIKKASVTLTTDNAFPDGGDLIVSSYKITVTS